MKPIKLLKSKTFLFSIILVVSFFSFISCGDLINTNNSSDSEPVVDPTEELLKQKKEAYNFF